MSTLNDWSQAIDQNVNFDVIYVDFMKALDKVPLYKLISKLTDILMHPKTTK